MKLSPSLAWFFLIGSSGVVAAGEGFGGNGINLNTAVSEIVETSPVEIFNTYQLDALALISASHKIDQETKQVASDTLNHPTSAQLIDLANSLNQERHNCAKKNCRKSKPWSVTVDDPKYFQYSLR